MKAKALNERQEVFCQGIMSGKTQRQAYYLAYPHSGKWKPENVDTKASQLINSDKVQTRLTELRAEAEEANKISRNDLLGQLKSIGFADLNANDIRPTDKIKAIELMVKILGYDKTEQSNSGDYGILSSILGAFRDA